MSEQYLADGECYRCHSLTSLKCSRCGKYVCVDHSVIDNNLDSYSGEKRYCFDCAQKPAKKEGCFIATAAYGTPFCNELDMLRAFRDTTLLPTRLGRLFVRAYYRLSPPVADFIRKKDSLKAIVRFALAPIIWILRKK